MNILLKFSWLTRAKNGSTLNIKGHFCNYPLQTCTITSTTGGQYCKTEI